MAEPAQDRVCTCGHPASDHNAEGCTLDSCMCWLSREQVEREAHRKSFDELPPVPSYQCSSAGCPGHPSKYLACEMPARPDYFVTMMAAPTLTEAEMAELRRKAKERDWLAGHLHVAPSKDGDWLMLVCRGAVVANENPRRKANDMPSVEELMGMLMAQEKTGG